MIGIRDLPIDIWCTIFEYLDPESHKNLLQTCKFFNKILPETIASVSRKIFREDYDLDYDREGKHSALNKVNKQYFWCDKYPGYKINIDINYYIQP